MPKILSISLAEEDKDEDSTEIGRILNVKEIELCFQNNFFYIQSDMTMVELREDDRILINKTLLKVNYRYISEELNHEDYDNEHEISNYVDPITEAIDEDHPLAFLFNDNFSEK